MSQLKLYIVEGADRVGKSTLSNYLAARLNLPLVHAGKPEAHLQASLGHNYQYDYLLTHKQSRVLDRSWISGLFYDLMRRNQPPNLRASWQLENQLIDAGYELNLVYVYRYWSTLLASQHLLEVKQGLGYGAPEERVLEHFAWPYFVHQLATKGHSQAHFWFANSDNLVNTIGHLSSYHHAAVSRPSASLFSSQLSKVIEHQTTHCDCPPIWSAIQWFNANPGRASNFAQRLFTASGQLTQRCFE